MKTILILSAGRRVELVNCFKKAAEKLHIKSKIIAADMSDTAPALYFADKYYILPRIQSDDYIESIIQICNNNHVDLIVPTIDTELLILAKNRKYIEDNSDAKVMICDLDIIGICRDKIKTYNFFISNGFLAPKVMSNEDIKNKNYQFPLFIKPLDGSSSINAFKINTEKELNFFWGYVSNPIVQEFISGEEFTVDVFCDFNSKIISISPRLRIVTRSGEILKGRIVKDSMIIDDIYRLVSIIKPIGHITIQCMKTFRGIEYIEINPRFGGGAPMSIMAGADSCEYLFRILNGEELLYQDHVLDHLTFCRFDDCICLDKNMVPIHD